MMRYFMTMRFTVHYNNTTVHYNVSPRCNLRESVDISAKKHYNEKCIE